MISSQRIDITGDTFNSDCCISSQLHTNHVNIFEGDYNNFFQQFLTRNQPVVIPNVSSNWKCSQLWVKNGLPNIDYLKTSYGNAFVSVADCNEKYFNAQRKHSMKFEDFANYWAKVLGNEYSSNDPCLYLKVRYLFQKLSLCMRVEWFLLLFIFTLGLAFGCDWHFTRDFPDENVYVVPPQFCSDWLNEYFTSHPDLNDDYRFVYMGPTGSWTPFHVDVFTSFSWSVNVCGEKRWILLEPGEEYKLKDKLGNLPYDISFLEDANYNINYVNVKYRTIIQKPGDAVFIPSGWFHQVWNTRDTISINHNWVNGCNIRNMWISMKTNFEDVKNEIAEFRNSMDDWHNHCQLMLKSCFGMDFKDFYHFIRYILQRRKKCVKTRKDLKVYGNWIISSNHVNFDLKKVKIICDIFENDPDVQILFDAQILTPR